MPDQNTPVEQTFAGTHWVADDVMSVSDLTKEQAEEFLGQYEGAIRDRMVEVGWDVINYYLQDFKDSLKDVG